MHRFQLLYITIIIIIICYTINENKCGILLYQISSHTYLHIYFYIQQFDNNNNKSYCLCWLIWLFFFASVCQSKYLNNSRFNIVKLKLVIFNNKNSIIHQITIFQLFPLCFRLKRDSKNTLDRFYIDNL